MAKRYSACLIGCGRMGATIDDEVRDHPQSFRWIPYSHAAGHTASVHTDLSGCLGCPPGEGGRDPKAVQRP